MESNNRKREIIKTALIIFLVVMLILTFFSNTIMNRSLPEVSTQYAQYKQINDRIKASATVSANQDFNVVGDEGREIAEVHVRRGEKVERGQLMFTLVENDSAALSDAEKALNQLLIQKQQMLKEEVDSEITDYDYEIRKKNEEITETSEKLLFVPQYKAKYEALELEIETMEDSLEEPSDHLEELKGKMGRYEATYDTVEEIEAEIDENEKLFNSSNSIFKKAEAAYDLKDKEIDEIKLEVEKLEDKNAEIDDAIEKANNKKGQYQEDMGSIGETNANIAELLGNMRRAKAALNVLLDEFSLFKHLKENPDDTEARNAYNELTEGTPSADSEVVYKAKIEEAQIIYDQAEAAYYEVSGKKEDASKYDDLIDDLNRDITEKTDRKNENLRQIAAYNKQITKLSEELSDLEKNMIEAESDKLKAEEVLKSAESRLEYAKLRDEAELLEKTLKAENKTLKKKQEELSDLEKDNPGDEDDLEDQLNLAKRELEVLERKKAADEKNEPFDEEIKRLEFANINDSIARQQKEVDRIKKKLVNTEITAPVSGTITSMSYTAGEEYDSGATLATIAINEKGFTMEFFATNEQCQRINVGQKASLQYFYYGSEPEIYVSAFRNDPSNPGRGKIVVLTVTGDDVSAGQTLNFTIGENSKSYDKVVPNSAVREDSNGKFILVVESKSTPLGNRYTARRVDVEVIASDETYSALSGELLGGEFVITTSSAPISDGMQVRLADK